MIARAVLREKFLAADIGITRRQFPCGGFGRGGGGGERGQRAAHFLAHRKIHIAVAGIEKLIPRAQDLAVFLKLLGRSATGQPLTSYTSFLSGPRRDGRGRWARRILSWSCWITAGQSCWRIRNAAVALLHPLRRVSEPLPGVPENRRTQLSVGLFGADRRNHHAAVPWCWQDPWLPFASSLCGACAEVCPVKIDIPKLLLDLRADVTADRKKHGGSKMERLAFRMFAWVMRHPGV